jgi:predicted MFS family arabinose efflux permease
MRRLVVLVGAIILVETMFYAAITPLLPELVERLDLGKNGAGLLTGAYAAGTVVGSLPAGWLTARIGVKPTLLLGLALLAVSGLAFAFGQSIVVLDGARFVQGLAGACAWAAGMTWIAATAPRERRGAALGSAMAAAVFGVQLGPVLGALATWIGQPAAFSSVVVFTVLLGLWAWATPGGAVHDDTPTQPGAALRERRMLAGMWLTALPAAAFGVLDVLAPLRLDELGAGALAIGATFFVAAGVEAVVNPTVGRFSDRHGIRRLVPSGLLASAVGLVLLQLPVSVPALAAGVVLVSALLGALWVPAMGLLTDGAERIGLDHGFAFAFFNLSWAGGFAVGSVAGGALAEASADAVPYGIAAALYLASAIGAALLAGIRRSAAPARG